MPIPPIPLGRFHLNLVGMLLRGPIKKAKFLCSDEQNGTRAKTEQRK